MMKNISSGIVIDQYFQNMIGKISKSKDINRKIENDKEIYKKDIIINKNHIINKNPIIPT